LSAGLSAVLIASLPAFGDPLIQITATPPYCSGGVLKGEVTGVSDPENYEVAPYIHVEGVGWWTKPTFAHPTVAVEADGSFEVDLPAGGLDCYATLYCVNVVQAGQTPPQANGLSYQPRSPVFLANDTVERYGREVIFAGRTWGVKEAPAAVGPGPNRFSRDAADVWVDPTGKLHLTVHQKGLDWYSTEVIPTEALGYGQYLIQTSSRVDQLDSNAVFGAFTWDAYGDPFLSTGRCNREIDFEDSRWSQSTGSENSQFVVQPWDTSGNLHRFEIPDLSADARLTRILKWEKDRLYFVLLKGHHSFDDWTQDDVIEEWEYLHDPGAGHFVPEPGDARFRLNLWLNNGSSPAGDGVLEVVVDDFAFVPEPSVLALLAAGGSLLLRCHRKSQVN
jgi:hypothetical protein